MKKKSLNRLSSKRGAAEKEKIPGYMREILNPMKNVTKNRKSRMFAKSHGKLI